MTDNHIVSDQIYAIIFLSYTILQLVYKISQETYMNTCSVTPFTLAAFIAWKSVYVPCPHIV